MQRSGDQSQFTGTATSTEHKLWITYAWKKNQMYCFLIKISFQEPEFIAPAVAILDSWLFTWQTQGAK